jgi:hypothetical protein
VDILLRVEGGDESLVDRIQANNRFQNYLRKHDPSHPLRAVGEHAEARQAEETVPEAVRRANVDMELGHRRRVLDLEYETTQKRLRLENERLEDEASAASEARVARIETVRRTLLMEEDFVRRKHEALEREARAESEARAAEARAESEARAAAALKESEARAAATLAKTRMEEDRIRAENEAALKRSELEADALRADAAANAVAKAAIHRDQIQASHDVTHEVFRRERATSIMANCEALKVVNGGRPLSPRTQTMVEDQLRTGLLGQERKDAELGMPLYCSKFLEETLLLKPEHARKRSSAFGGHVKTAMALLFPAYGEQRTNRVVNGYNRDVRMYYDVHRPAFVDAAAKYVANAPIGDNELTTQGLQARRSASNVDIRRMFRAV